MATVHEVVISTFFEPSLKSREGFSHDRALFRGFAELTPVTFRLQLGDGAAPTRLYSLGRGTVSPKRAEAC